MGILLMINMKDMENIFLKQEIIIKDILKMILNMVKEKNIIKMELLNMKEILLKIEWTDLEGIII